jgi:hypothetical protein
VRLLVRVLIGLCCLAAFTAAAYGCGAALRWLQSGQLVDRQPDHPVALGSLNDYTRRVAGRPWFRAYFETMVFDQLRDRVTAPSARVTKWERHRVTIRLLNGDGPRVEVYLRQLVARLDRLQGQVRFVVGGGDPPLITIRFLTHDAYARSEGTGSVGNTRTRYYTGSPGLIRARITIDVGAQNEPDEVKSTLIHELTHAIGCSGHFYAPSYQRRSVMYNANTLTAWSQDDAAVIRLLYSPLVRVGMSPSQAEASMRLFAAGRGR